MSGGWGRGGLSIEVGEGGVETWSEGWRKESCQSGSVRCNEGDKGRGWTVGRVWK